MRLCALVLLGGCAADAPVEEGANAIACACRCTVVNVDLPFGRDELTTTRSQDVCVPEEARGELGDFQAWCDEVCFGVEQALDANYGCESSCEVASTGSRARWWSACDAPTCEAAWCEDCLPLLRAEGRGAWKDCIQACNGVEEDFVTGGDVPRCGEAFGPLCVPGPDAPPAPGGCTHAGGGLPAAAALAALLRIRPGRRRRS